jgi:alkylhydroperoxidase/carboxymuconolactone decarboxylase family protein
MTTQSNSAPASESLEPPQAIEDISYSMKNLKHPAYRYVNTVKKMSERWNIIVDTYYNPKDLAHFPEVGEEAPELWKKWLDWYNAVFAEGALSEREKALIALAVAHAVQCPYCIDAYSSSCLEKGSDLEQMTEAIHVAAAIRSGSSLVHGVQMRNHVHKLSM